MDTGDTGEIEPQQVQCPSKHASAPAQSQFTQSVAQAWTTSVYGNCTLERGYLNMNIC